MKPGMKIDWREDQERLYRRYRKEHNPRVRRRLRLLSLLREGQTLKEATQAVGVHYRTGQRWVAWYREGGIEALYRRGDGTPEPIPAEPVGEPDSAAPTAVSTSPLRTANDRLHSLQALSTTSSQEPLAVTYCLQREEPLPQEIRRIALEQIDHALWQLVAREENRSKAVHEARKNFKKIRAVLRLVRDEIGEQHFKQENICYRDAGRRLAAVRESAVMVETLDDITSHFAGELLPNRFAGVREGLVEMHQVACRRILDEEDAMTAVATTIHTTRSRFLNLPIERDDFSALYNGLRRVYRRGRNRLADAYDAPSPESFHEWRKRVKYLWYHMRVLQPVWPSGLAWFAGELDGLADALGIDHDLADLRQVVEETPTLFRNEEEQQWLLLLIARRRREIETAVQPLGERIYVEKPRAFVGRIGAYWRIMRQESPSPLSP